MYKNKNEAEEEAEAKVRGGAPGCSLKIENLALNIDTKNEQCQTNNLQ